MLALRLTIVASLILAPTVARAEQWIEYGRNTTGTVFFYDFDSLKQQGTSYTVWTLRDHSNDKTVKERSSKVRYYLHCLNETITLLTFVDYAADGRVIDSVTLKSYELEARPIVPGSIGTALFDALCA